MRLAQRLLGRTPAAVASRFGSHSAVARLARPVVNRLLPDEPAVVTVRAGLNRGVRLPLYLREEKYYWTGVYEEEVQHALAVVLRPGMTFWDVGAHIGFFSLLASRLVGPAGGVRAFEPMPINRARLEQALALNGAENVRVDPRAVGAEPAKTILHRHQYSTMWSLAGAAGGDGVSVDVTTLDAVAAAEGPPDVVKIDVEETALAALEGAPETLRRPGLVVIVETDRSLPPSAIRSVAPDCTVGPVGARHQLVRLP